MTTARKKVKDYHMARRRLAQPGNGRKCRHPRCTIRGHFQPHENFRTSDTDTCSTCEEREKKLKRAYIYDFDATHPHPPIHKAMDAFLRGKTIHGKKLASVAKRK